MKCLISLKNFKQIKHFPKPFFAKKKTSNKYWMNLQHKQDKLTEILTGTLFKHP